MLNCIEAVIWHSLLFALCIHNLPQLISQISPPLDFDPKILMFRFLFQPLFPYLLPHEIPLTRFQAFFGSILPKRFCGD